MGPGGQREQECLLLPRNSRPRYNVPAASSPTFYLLYLFMILSHWHPSGTHVWPKQPHCCCITSQPSPAGIPTNHHCQEPNWRLVVAMTGCDAGAAAHDTLVTAATPAHKCSLLAAGSSSNVPVSSRLRFLPLETETDGQSQQTSTFLLGDLRPDAQIPDIERCTLVLLQRSRCPVPPKTASLVQNDGSGVLI